MALIRNVSGIDRHLPWQLDQLVKANATVNVPDEHVDAYVCQTDVWRRVTDKPAKRAAAHGRRVPQNQPAAVVAADESKEN